MNDDVLKFNTDSERIWWWSNIMGVQGYYPCNQCNRLHPLFQAEQVLDYYENKEEFKKHCTEK